VLLPLRIRQIEDRQEDGPVGRGLATAFATRLLVIRISVRPIVVRCATMKAINTTTSTIVSGYKETGFGESWRV
jgi:hypothetical protein